MARVSKNFAAPPAPAQAQDVAYTRRLPRRVAHEALSVTPMTGTAGLAANPTLPGPMPVLPRLSVVKSTTLADVMAVPTPVLAASMDNVVAVRPYYARPGVAFLVPHLATAATATGVVEPFGLGAKASGPINGGQSFGASAYTDTAVGTLGLTHMQQAGYGQTFSFMFSDGYAALSAGALLAVGTGWVVPSLQVVGWDDSLGLYANGAYINPVTSVVAFGTVSYARSAQRRIVYLGPYGGALHHIQIRRRGGWSASLRAGGGLLWIAGQVRLGESRSSDIIYRTFLDSQRARALVFSDHGLKGHLANFARALNLKPEPLNIPKLNQPERLLVGDELVEVRSRSTIYAAMVGNLAVWAGLQVFLKGDIEFAARRLDTHHVELTITPLTIRSWGAFLIGSMGPQGSYDVSHAHAWRQAFTFDLREDDAQRAYQAAVMGRLPGHMRVVRDSRRTLFREAGEHPVWSAHMPTGVCRLYTQYIHTQQARAGGGVYAYIVPRKWLPHGWQAGWMRHRIRLRDTQEARDATVRLWQDTRLTEVRRTLGWHGLASRRVVATRHFSAPAATCVQHFEALHVTASFCETHATAAELNARICTPLRTYFGVDLDAVPQGAPKQDRQVTLVRDFDAADLLTVATTHTVATDDDVDALARQCKLRPGSLRRFLQRIASPPDAAGRATVAQRYLQKHGVAAFAALGCLAPAPPEHYVLESSTEVYRAAQHKTQTLLLKIPTALKHVSKRDIRALKKGIVQVEAAQKTLNADIFYPQGARSRWRTRLQEQHVQLNTRLRSVH